MCGTISCIVGVNETTPTMYENNPFYERIIRRKEDHCTINKLKTNGPFFFFFFLLLRKLCIFIDK